MSDSQKGSRHIDRRRFLQAAAAGLTTAGAMLTPRERALAQNLAEKARFERIAGCTWPIRSLFKSRQNPNRGGSNNAPFGLADFGSPEADARRKAGVAMAKRWIEGCSVLAPVSMRMNSPQALGPSIRPNAIPRSGDGYPRNLEIVPLLNAAIESYKEMADFGGKYGVKVTFENHWGLAADPMNIRIMIDAVNHPYCDATPDFGNWEHEHMLFSGLKALAPYTSSNVHAKYWDRWGEANDVQRSVRIMMAAGFKGTFALEYEAGPLNGVEGAKYLYKEVLAALTEG
jgi:sugar phosphate isomerase/epimerase